MATLEKIRSRSVLLIVIIGIALIAFIIGDFLNSGRSVFGTGTTVAKVDGQKFDINEFQRRLQQQSDMYQQRGQKIDGAVLEQQVLESMVNDALFKKELQRLGITVTDQELADVMLGRGASILSNRIAQESQGQITSIQQLHSMITRPAEFGLTPEQANSFRAYWTQLENETSEQLMQQKFMTLFTGSLVANELDAKYFYEETATPANVAYVKKDFSLLPSEDYTVTDEDINNEWAKYKNAYRLNEPMRAVEYLSVAIVPSPDDIMAGQQKVEDAIATLRTADDATALAGMTDFVVDNRRQAAGKTDRNMKAFLDTASVGAAGLISRNANNFVIAKLLKKSVEVDSVNIDAIAVQGKAQLDSVLTALRAGASFEQMAQNPAVVNSSDSIWLSLSEAAGSPMTEVIANAPLGVYFTNDTAANVPGGTIYRVNRRRAPVNVYEYAYVTYSIEPSEATINKLESDLAAFLAENKTAQAFSENAIQAGYQVFPAKVSASTPALGNLQDSRGPIVWALDAKKGEVSPIFGGEETGRYIALAVDDIYEDFIPARDPQVREYLNVRVLGQKKGDAMMEQYAGKASDLNGYAQLMGAPVDTVKISFGQVSVPQFGMNEGELQANAALAAPGKLVGPFKANTSVVVMQVINNDEATRPYVFSEAAETFRSNRGSYRLSNVLPQILMGNKEVTNNLSKFYHRDR